MPVWIIQLLISVVLNVASAVISAVSQQDQQAKDKAIGVRGSTRTGGDQPLTFIIGNYATGGHRLYPRSTFGVTGGTPNEFLVDVIGMSGLAIRGYSGHYIFGERVTLDYGNPHAEYGFPVLEYRVNGIDHIWTKEYDGNQTVADAYLVDKFGSDPDRPWKSDMVGRGVAYVIYTARVNRELFPSAPEYMAEVDGCEMSDPRGDNEHENAIVQIENVLSGFYHDGLWVYGPQNVNSHRRPYANGGEAEMDKCDALIALDGGGSEKRFRTGMEISCDVEPHIIIGELLKGCTGRIAEIGGKYRVLVGEPNAPVLSFTDEDILVTEGQSYDPFPGLEATHNAITASYPERGEAWELKDAPARYSSALEAEDGGRRLPFNTTYNSVPYANQVQRLMRSAIEEARRFKKHSFTGGPEWWEYEPLDTVQWTSERNGYDGKLQLITVIEDLPNANQVIGLQEQDPTDYSWSTDYELPFDLAPLTISRPAPQVVTGVQAVPAILYDNTNAARRPSVSLEGVPSGMVDVQFIRIQVRLDGGTALAFDGVIEYDIEEVDPEYVLNGVFLPITDYEMRAKYVPYSGRKTLWSNQYLDGDVVVDGAWLAVKTPDVRIASGDLADAVNEVRTEGMKRLNDLAEYMNSLGNTVANQDASNREEIKAKFGKAAALVVQEAITRADETGSLASSVTSVLASYGEVSASGLFSMVAQAAPDGWDARITMAVRASTGDGFVLTAISLDAKSNGESRIILDADQVVFTGTAISINEVMALNFLTGGFSIVIPD